MLDTNSFSDNSFLGFSIYEILDPYFEIISANSEIFLFQQIYNYALLDQNYNFLQPVLHIEDH